MKKVLFASSIFGAMLMLAACGGKEEAAPTSPTEVDAEAVVNQSCISCHGENLEGRGQFPKLADVGSRLTEEEILEVITKGRGAMPAGIIQGAEAEAVAAWLAEKK